jgi:putative endonuclease
VNTKDRGDQGEDAAAGYLAARGYHIVKRNLRCRSGEVDIVVYKDDSLVFTEVKHWLTIPIDDLERSITAAKRRRIVGCARSFVSENPQWEPFRLRFDIVYVGPDQITHFEDAFTESGFQ